MKHSDTALSHEAKVCWVIQKGPSSVDRRKKKSRKKRQVESSHCSKKPVLVTYIKIYEE